MDHLMELLLSSFANLCYQEDWHRFKFFIFNALEQASQHLYTLPDDSSLLGNQTTALRDSYG